jgi:RNA polymerase sigma-70 factor (ECF subfamily)
VLALSDGNVTDQESPASEPLTSGHESAAAAAKAPLEETRGARNNVAKDDEGLVDRARAGDTAAFGELIQRYYNSCLRRASSIIRNRTDAEDEVQNACWKAFERLPQFRGVGSFAAWLNRIVENQCLMRLRENRQSLFLHLDRSSESNIRVELVEQVANPEDDLGKREVEDLVRREISRIPSFLRTVMVLYDVEHLPMPTVAAQLGLSVPAAKSRLGRARGELRARLSKYCGRRGQSTLTARSRYSQLAYTRGE